MPDFIRVLHLGVLVWQMQCHDPADLEMKVERDAASSFGDTQYCGSSGR